MLARANAGLSSTFYHFREMTTSEALTATIDYLTQHPESFNSHRLDSYLEPIIDLIPQHLDENTGNALGILLATMEKARHIDHHSTLAQRIITRLREHDHHGIAIKAAIASLANERVQIHFLYHDLASLVDIETAEWIMEHTPGYAPEIGRWIPAGPVRDLLAPLTPAEPRAQDDAIARYQQQERERQEALLTTRNEHQQAMRTSRELNVVLDACQRLPQEHWPELATDQRDWLAEQTSNVLFALDLANTIHWQDEHTWTQPRALKPLLLLLDHYSLHLATDVPLVLALNAFPEKAIAKYYRREGISPEARQELAYLLRTAANDSITHNVLQFIREAEYDAPEIREILSVVATDQNRPSQTRIDAIERLVTIEPRNTTIENLATDNDQDVRDHVFRHLVRQQHQPTIRRALATLEDDDLRQGEAQFPGDSSLNWIAAITAPFAWNELRQLRVRALRLGVWRAVAIITETMAKIDQARTARVIRQQLDQAPAEWRRHQQQEADKVALAARINRAQQAPFDQVIRKLKGATSMIHVKVWCEGPTDRPIFRTLCNDAGEVEIANTLDFVAGWPTLLAETQPERWLDGCRQAFIVMDADEGRDLTRENRPLTEQAREIQRRFGDHPLQLRVLQRFGIENYVPRHAYEAVLLRDLTSYFPLPETISILEHFRDQDAGHQTDASFYRKNLNQAVAQHLHAADISETDLAAIINEITRVSEQAHQY